MAQISTNDFRTGAKVELDGQPYIMVFNEFVKPGKGQAFNRIKLKNLFTGRIVEKTMKSGDKLERADIHESNMRMLYKDSDGFVFMDDESFDQVTVPFENIKDVKHWIKDEVIYEIIFYKDAPVLVNPPTFMELKVIETTPGERGDTSGRVLKPAKTETGGEIQIPIFINEGEIIKIDTRTNEYVSRVNK
jgi:elongation factor P